MPVAVLLRHRWGDAGRLMLLAELGSALLLTALALVAFSGVKALAAAWRGDAVAARVARRAFYATAAAGAGASATLLAALLTRDFQVAFVAEHTDRSLSPALTAAAFYGGQEGSLLYWLLLLLLCGAAALAAAGGTDVRLGALANVFLAGIAAFFLVVLVFVASPFALLEVAPPDGLGLNPVLRDGGMLVHPPFLLAGYSAFAIPFAFAMAALVAGRRGGGSEAWIAQTRRFALVAWGLQSVGLVLGMWWAYHVLGWGGYWGWDPVENAALMPWLATTAYLHSAQVQERRGALRAWSFGLVIAAFLLALLGTFIVRSGVLPSVHTFAISPLGPWFFGFFLVSVAVSGAALAGRAGELGSRPLETMASREGAFLLQNVLLVALTGAVLWGTLLPLVSGMFGRQLVVGPAYYERVGAPLFVAVLALLAAGPLLPWGRVSRAWARDLRWPLGAAGLALAALLLAGIRQPGALLALPLAAGGLATCVLELGRGARAAGRTPAAWPAAALRLAARHRRRYGAHLVHAGVLLAAVGLAGSHFFQQERQAALRPGESLAVGWHTLTYEGSSERVDGDHQVLTARVRLGGETLEPARLTYPGLGGQALSQVAIRTSPLEDVYVVLAGRQADVAAFHVFVNPLVPWIWAGAALIVVGVLVGNLARPEAEPAPAPAPTGTPAAGAGTQRKRLVGSE